MPVSELHKAATSNNSVSTIELFLFITIFTTLAFSNTQFLNVKLLVGFLGQASK